VLIDATTLPPDHVVRTDVCIVGAGPGGLSVATRLAGTALGVVVLDAGAEDAEQTPPTCTPGSGARTAATRTPPVDVVRSQGVGGTAVQWLEAGQSYGVRLKRLEEQDFQRRDWMPHSGWPFGRAELDPFYDRAEDAFLVGRFADDITAASPESVRHPLAVGPLTAAEFRFSRRYTLLDGQRAAFTGRGNVDVYTRSTVTELDDGDTPGAVDRAHVRSAPGRGFTVQARWFVLAAGGIGNPHLLLLSNRTRPEGLGNEHDNVGRFFADHPAFNHVGVRLHDPQLIARLGEYDTADRGGVGILRAVSSSRTCWSASSSCTPGPPCTPGSPAATSTRSTPRATSVSTLRQRPLGAPAAALRHAGTIARAPGRWSRPCRPAPASTSSPSAGRSARSRRACSSPACSPCPAPTSRRRTRTAGSPSAAPATTWGSGGSIWTTAGASSTCAPPAAPPSSSAGHWPPRASGSC
jgi:hypothetical protein